MALTGAEHSKLYRERNPERWKNTINNYCKKKYTCECGITLCNKLRPKHLKTRRHNERMELINQINQTNTKNELTSEEDSE
jgi:hypothetical protein